MYINRLHLRAFGKFIGKKINFGTKFNIIFGENESGKSTIHNFIESVMYGFDDMTEFNKYKPWKSNLYKGTVKIEHGKKNYVISRNFLLDTVQVFKKAYEVNESNEENEDNETNDYFIKNIQVPGEHFFNINRLTFNNTVSISQLGNKTEKELADELKNKIINLSNTKDEDISIDRILRSLNRIKEEAGSENDEKTLLGQYALRLKELERAKENSLISNRQVMFLAMEKKKLQSKLHEINMRIDEKNKEIFDYELTLEKQKVLKAQPLMREIDNINQELRLIERDVADCSKEDYKEASETESSLASMKNERQRMLEEKADSISELKLNELDLCNYIPPELDIDRLNEDYGLFKVNGDKINALKIQMQSDKESIDSINIDEINMFINDYMEVEELNRKLQINNVLTDKINYDLLKSFGKKQGWMSFLYGLLSTAFISAAAASCYRAYFYNNINYYYGGIGFLIGIIFLVFSWRKRNIALNSKKEIESMECEHADYILSNNKLNKQIDEIVKRYNHEDYNAMADAYQKKGAEKSIYEKKTELLNNDDNILNQLLEENGKIKERLNKSLSSLNLSLSQDNIREVNDAYERKDNVKLQIENLNNKIEQMDKDIIRLNKEISFEEKRLEMILNANGAEDVEAFKKAVELNERHKVLLNRREYTESILKNVIGSTDYFELRSKTMNVSEEVKEIDKQDIQLSIFRLNEEKTKMLKNIDDIHNEIEDIEDNTRNLAEIEEEINFYDEKIRSFNNKIKTAEIAAEKISKISNSIKGDFMPLLRSSISDDFSYLTGGRYKSVNIDEGMNITVMSEEEKDRKIELENLSGGTLDQLYLSLRITLSNILSGKQNIPLILDDSFVQYDSKRLGKSLEMLSRESERRQVILFTCQEREAELSKQMNIPFNYIKL
jgi:chromosome segregation ATPase